MNSSFAIEPPPLPKRRPALVWVIALFYAVGLFSTIASYAIVFSPSFPANAAQKQYFSSLTLIDHALTFLVVMTNAAGAVMLFQLKKLAPVLFASAFAVAVVTVIYQCLVKNWLAAVGVAGLVGAAFSWAVNIAIITYTFVLKKRGVLS